LELEQPVAQEVEKVHVGDAASVMEFVRSFGSHYIESYVTGNSLYQVLWSHQTRGVPWCLALGENFTTGASPSQKKKKSRQIEI
jgi:hypothetical protein